MSALGLSAYYEHFLTRDIVTVDSLQHLSVSELRGCGMTSGSHIKRLSRALEARRGQVGGLCRAAGGDITKNTQVKVSAEHSPPPTHASLRHDDGTVSPSQKTKMPTVSKIIDKV